MRQPTARLRIGTNLGAWLAVLAVWAGTCGLAHGQTPAGPPPDLPQSSEVEERLRRVEEMNARLLEQLKSDRQESARRYGELEDRYRELQRGWASHVPPPRQKPRWRPARRRPAARISGGPARWADPTRPGNSP